MPEESIKGVETTLAAGMLDQREAAVSRRSSSVLLGSDVAPSSEESSEAPGVAMTATERGVETIRKSTSMSEARESMNLGHREHF
jgi:hypothetical protein